MLRTYKHKYEITNCITTETDQIPNCGHKVTTTSEPSVTSPRHRLGNAREEEEESWTKEQGNENENDGSGDEDGVGNGVEGNESDVGRENGRLYGVEGSGDGLSCSCALFGVQI